MKESIKAYEVASVIENFAPLKFQEEWDNAGFCVGSPDSEVTGVLISLDVTPELVSEAKEKGLNMIVTHHPLIFGGVKKITGEDLISKVIIDAIKNDIVIYSAHTNADKTPDGVSWLMAEKLGLRECRVLAPDTLQSMDVSRSAESGSGDVGLGIIGELENEITSEELISLLKSRFNLISLRTSRPLTTPVKRVALCGGSGKSLLAAAKREGADIYISGDMPYHDFFVGKDDKFMLIDIGHYESEVDIVGSIYSLITKKIPNFAVYIAKANVNPVYYF